MQEFGPTQAAEVKQLVEDRTLGPNDRVRPASSSTWISVTEFMSMAPWSDVAEIADVAEIDERHLQLDIDSFNLEGNSAGRPNADLDIDAFNLQGNGDSPLPVAVNSHRPVSAPEAEPDEDDEPAPNYFVRSLGHELGPLTQEALIEMARAGAFSRGDEIREGDHGKWIAIESITGGSDDSVDSSIDNSSPDESSPDESSTGDSSAGQKQSLASGTASRKKASRLKQSKSQPGGKPAVKKKRKPKKDEFLQEIFAELFTEDGKLKENRTASPVASATAAVAAQANPTDGAVSSATSGNSVSSGGLAATVPMAASTGSWSPPSQASQFSSPQPQFRPSKPSSKSGGGLNPMVLGIAGGVVAVLLIAGLVYSGVFTPMKPAPDGKGLCQDFIDEYAAADKGSESDWKAFREKFSEPSRQLARELAPHAGTNPEAKRQLMVAVQIYAIFGRGWPDKEGRQKLFDEMVEAWNAP